MYFLSDGEYQWNPIMLFPTRDIGERWLHEFYKNHGKTVMNGRTSVMTNVLEFGASTDLFDNIDAENGKLKATPRPAVSRTAPRTTR